MATAKKSWKKSEGKMGKNIAFAVDEKGILTLTVDLNIRLGKSASGKTTIIGTSSGNVAIEGGEGAVIGINCYSKE